MHKDDRFDWSQFDVNMFIATHVLRKSGQSTVIWRE